MGKSSKTKSQSWAAITGNWEFGPEKITYASPQDNRAPFGVALTSARIRGGRISTTVTVKDPKESAARILIGYNVATRNYYSIGIGGYDFAYVIDEFVEGRGWRAITAAGSKNNLGQNRKYELDVEVRGQRVSLHVDGIEVLAGTLPFPMGGSQIGVFAWGPGEVQFEQFRFDGEMPRAFVVMQFSEPYNSLYSEVIKPVAEKLGFSAFRADDVFKPGIILQDIIRGLIESDVIVAEITPSNQNVFYELGYAHALGKPTVLLATRDSELPFDISSYRCIFYDNTIKGKKDIEDTLERHLNSIIRGE